MIGGIGCWWVIVIEWWVWIYQELNFPSTGLSISHGRRWPSQPGPPVHYVAIHWNFRFPQVKAQFLLNFDPNLIFPVLTDKQLFKYWRTNIPITYLPKMGYLLAKHCKNCECCHHHSVFKGFNVIVHIVVFNCQKCYFLIKRVTFCCVQTSWNAYYLYIASKKVLELDGAKGEKIGGVSFSGQTKLAEIGGKSA